MFLQYLFKYHKAVLMYMLTMKCTVYKITAKKKSEFIVELGE